MSKCDKLLEVAITLSEKHGYDKITRDQISAAGGVSTGTVTNTLGTMKQMRRKIIRHATRTGNNVIIAQAIVNREPYASKLSPEARQAALMSVA